MPQIPDTGPAWLVLPTYNEAENVEAFVDRAGQAPRLRQDPDRR